MEYNEQHFESETNKIYLNVPFEEKDQAKGLGAKWDFNERKWYFTDINKKDLFEKWMVKPSLSFEDLSNEQKRFVNLVKKGRNVLVDACIGSGKTTAIQVVCNELPNKEILYLTYNYLLKTDAMNKILNNNVFVTNYHGFAYQMLRSINVECAQGQLIQTFLKHKDEISIPHYDLLLMDEYQDITEEIASMLKVIRKANPRIQIVAVGDMQQKIYDWTTLDVGNFISRFLTKKKTGYEMVSFTNCFRINKKLAKQLGNVWNKQIKGVNFNCKVEYMSESEAYNFISRQNPGDLLCLGPREGGLSKMLNKLEDTQPHKFNKNTVYASIRDNDSYLKLGTNNAIFTTYDSCKGMERPICVVFDYDDTYWMMRHRVGDTDHEILRNIFCVAASRGKEKIIFVQSDKRPLDFKSLKKDPMEDANKDKVEDFSVSEMFSFKYIEQVEKCYQMLDIRPIEVDDTTPIDIKANDGLIDLSPCIGNYQEAMYFDYYNIDNEIEYAMKVRKKKRLDIENPPTKDSSIQEKVLFLSALDTTQKRYYYQVDPNFITNEESELIKRRLSSVFRSSACVQQDMEPMGFVDKENRKALVINGRADVLKKHTVYELKFVSELSHEHFLQCAMYVVGFNLPKGVLWNVRTNERYEVRVPDREAFMSQVLRTITKGRYFNNKEENEEDIEL